MASCLIFHGPAAKDTAIRKALEVGHLMAPPFGEDGGLSTEEAREMVAQLLNTPLKSGLGVVIAGPMDGVKSRKASDVLLKSIEEFDDKVVLPILWANDLGGVSSTIRSRCLDIWCPGKVMLTEEDDDLMRVAWEFVAQVQEGDIAGIAKTAKSVKDENSSKMLTALAEVLASQIQQPKSQVLWMNLRRIAGYERPKPAEILVSLLKAAKSKP